MITHGRGYLFGISDEEEGFTMMVAEKGGELDD